MLHKIIHKERYYWHFNVRTKRISGVFSAICVAVSLSSVSAWGIWKNVPLLWSFIIALAQLIQALSPRFPFSRQIISLKYLLPCLSKLTLDIENFWLDIDESDDKKIRAKIKQFESEYDALIRQFIGDTYFPRPISRIDKYAENDCAVYLGQRYHVWSVDNG